MRIKFNYLLFLLALPLCAIPTFQVTAGQGSYTLVGRDPAQGGTTIIPAVIVPIALSFDGKTVVMDAAPDVARVLRSPVFSKFAFPAAFGKVARSMASAYCAAPPDGKAKLENTGERRTRATSGAASITTFFPSKESEIGTSTVWMIVVPPCAGSRPPRV